MHSFAAGDEGMEAHAGVNQISATRVSDRGNTPRKALFPLLFPQRFYESVDEIGSGAGRLAGPLESQKLLSDRFGKIDEGELRFVEQIVISTLVDDPH
jgi:hypothetical protein